MNSAGKGSGRRKHIASCLDLHRRVRLEGDLGALCHANGEALLIVMGCKGNLWYIDGSARDFSSRGIFSLHRSVGEYERRTADRTGGEEADEECAISCHGVTNHPRVIVGPWGRTRSVTTAARVSAVGAKALIGHSRTN